MRELQWYKPACIHMNHWWLGACPALSPKWVNTFPTVSLIGYPLFFALCNMGFRRFDWAPAVLQNVLIGHPLCYEIPNLVCSAGSLQTCKHIFPNFVHCADCSVLTRL